MVLIYNEKFGVGYIMENKIKMPAAYNVMNEEEMTYTCGGDAYDDSYAIGWLIGSTISFGNYVWGVAKTRQWIKENKEGRTIGELLSKGMDDMSDYMSKSVGSALIGTYSILNVAGWSITLWPVTLIAWVTA